MSGGSDEQLSVSRCHGSIIFCRAYFSSSILFSSSCLRIASDVFSSRISFFTSSGVNVARRRIPSPVTTSVEQLASDIAIVVVRFRLGFGVVDGGEDQSKRPTCRSNNVPEG